MYRAPLALTNGKLTLRVFVDACSVEIFANDGSTVLSALVFPDATATGIEFFSEGGTAVLSEFNIWELNSVWK